MKLAGFFNACDSLENTAFSVANHTFPVLFRLLYGCGLRLDEALSLLCEDVDLENGRILIRNAKNGLDRQLPLSEALTDCLQSYSNAYIKNYNEGRLFFLCRRRKKITGRTVYNWFRIILYKANISHGGRGKGPRIHDFRHTFSVYSMLEMSQNGLDMYYSLPLLSEYLGHQSLEATEQYVRLTSAMFPEIIAKANKTYGFIFPEVELL